MIKINILQLFYEPVAGLHPGEDVVEGVFVEIEEGVRIVQETVFASADPAFAGTMRMTWEVREDGSGSFVDIRAENVPVGIAAAEHRTGIAASLRHLAEVAPADARGQVMSAYYLLGYLAMGIPTVTAGALATRYGTATIFPWFAAAVSQACLAAAAFGVRDHRSATR